MISMRPDLCCIMQRNFTKTRQGYFSKCDFINNYNKNNINKYWNASVASDDWGVCYNVGVSVVRPVGPVRLYFTCYAYWHRQHRAARPPRPPAWPASPPPPPPTSTKHAEYSANFIGLFSNYGPDKPNPVLWTFKLGQSSVASHTEYLNIHVQTRLRLLLSSFNWSKFQTKKKLALLINQLK